jgi:hypothetical protein
LRRCQGFVTRLVFTDAFARLLILHNNLHRCSKDFFTIARINIACQGFLTIARINIACQGFLTIARINIAC